MSDWPVVDFDPPGNAPYRDLGTQRSAAKNVSELIVHVDLTQKRVVYVQPFGPDVKIIPGQDVLPRQKRSSGY
jgi:hypothetical protein